MYISLNSNAASWLLAKFDRLIKSYLKFMNPVMFNMF